MNIAVLISGRFYNTDNKCINILINDNKDSKFKTFLHIWEIDYTPKKIPIKNDIDKIVSNYNCNDYIVEDFNKVLKNNEFSNTYYIQNYNRYRNLQQIIDNKYDIYIIMRPDIIYIKNLNLQKLNVKDNTIYVYRSPDFAKKICYDFCDWFLLFNNSVFEKIKEVFKNKMAFMYSNEYTLKSILLKYNFNIVTLGQVSVDIKHKYFHN